jgi:tripartite-type tricarboxylate transporter receptor subunit TctC
VVSRAEASYALIARKDFPASNLTEFVSYEKANTNILQFGSGGVGANSHIACVMLNTAMGSRITHIPYRGSGPAMQNLIGGRVDFLCDSLTTAVPQIQNGAVKPIAILSSRRSPVLPNLATAEEQGLTGIDVDSWDALFLSQRHARGDHPPLEQSGERDS